MENITYTIKTAEGKTGNSNLNFTSIWDFEAKLMEIGADAVPGCYRKAHIEIACDGAPLFAMRLDLTNDPASADIINTLFGREDFYNSERGAEYFRIYKHMIVRRDETLTTPESVANSHAELARRLRAHSLAA